MKRVATGFILFLSAASCFAACSATTAPFDEVKSSDEVLIGTVESAHIVPQTWDALDGTEYSVRIDQKVKGKRSGQIKILIERTDDSGVLAAGTQYLFFLTNTNQHWMINKCGNSGPLEEQAQVIKELVRAAGND